MENKSNNDLQKPYEKMKIDEREPHKKMCSLKGKAVLIHPWSYSCYKFDDKS